MNEPDGSKLSGCKEGAKLGSTNVPKEGRHPMAWKVHFRRGRVWMEENEALSYVGVIQDLGSRGTGWPLYTIT